MLTDGEVTGMRTTMELSLPGTAIIQTASWTSDGGGGGTTTWDASGTVDCRVTPVTNEEIVAGSRLQPDTEVIFTIPQDTTIDTDARILYESSVYTVTSTMAPRTWEISRRVQAKEVE